MKELITDSISHLYEDSMKPTIHNSSHKTVYQNYFLWHFTLNDVGQIVLATNALELDTRNVSKPADSH